MGHRRRSSDASRKRFTDPVTGDPLTMGEEVSWLLQGLVRRWSVFIAITLFTCVAWTIGRIWAQPLTDIWNLFASFWAMALETIVGIAMFAQTRRDAVIIRTIMHMEEQQAQALQHLRQLMDPADVDPGTDVSTSPSGGPAVSPPDAESTRSGGS